MSNVAAFPKTKPTLASLRLYSLVYLATPYSKFKPDIEEAYREACKISAGMLLRGIRVYSPIAHTHGIAIHGGLDPLDHSLWLSFDETMMRAAQALVIAKMEGWQSSKGIGHEMEFFQREGKPYYLMDPDTLEIA